MFRTAATIWVPVNEMNPMAIADSGTSHVILPMTALNDDKSAKKVNPRLAAREIAAVAAHRETFAQHVTIPLCPLGRVTRKLQLIAIWDSADFDINLCEQVWNSTWFDAMSHQGSYSLFHWMLRRAFATPE